MSQEGNIGVAEIQTPASEPLPVRSPGPRRLTRLILPRLPAVFFCIGLLQMLFVTPGPQVLFRDSDAGWHIRNGEAILANRAAPRADSFSYSRAGRPWFAWEWLADALLGGVHRAGGVLGVSFLAAVAIVLSTAAAVKLSLTLGANFFLAALGGFAVLGTTSIHWLARPHIFSWLLAIAFLAVAERERCRSTRLLFLLPPLACLWSNMHGSFLLAPAILLVYAAGELLNGKEGRRARLRLAAAGLASLLATFINPYGWKVHGHILTYLRDSYIMDHVAEFRSFSFHQGGAVYVELFLAMAAAGTVALFAQRQWGPALLAVALLKMALYSARHLPTAAVLLTPLCVAALTREMEKWAALRTFLDYSDRVRALGRQMSGAATVVAVLILTALGLYGLSLRGQVGFNPEIFPVRAAGYLEQRGLDRQPPATQPRLFAADQFGGYLIYRFNGRLKVFIDGRSDFYGRDMLEQYAQVMEAKPGWDRVLTEYNVRFVLVRSDQVLSSVLSIVPGWKRVYADALVNVFEKTAGG